MILGGEAIAFEFTTQLATGALTDADSNPSGDVVRNGINQGETVTIANKATGIYKGSFQSPSGVWVSGDVVQVRVKATMGGVAAGGVVWDTVVSPTPITASGIADAVLAEPVTDHKNVAGSLGKWIWAIKTLIFGGQKVVESVENTTLEYYDEDGTKKFTVTKATGQANITEH